MKLKKTKLVLAFLGMAAFSLTACNPGGEGEGPGGEGGTTEHVHNYGELISQVDATCTEAGTVAYYKCDGCNKYFNSDKEEIQATDLILAAKGHDLQKVDGKAATCVEDGWNDYYQCKNDTSELFQDADGLTPIEDLGAWKLGDGKISKKGHSYGEWYTVTAPTCTENGEQKRDCADCDAFETQSVNALGHDMATVWSTDDVKHWHECLREGCTYKEDEANHTFGDWITVKAATCTEAGSKKHVCSVCLKEVFEDIPALDHDKDTAWTANETQHWHECKNEGCEEKFDAANHSLGETVYTWAEDGSSCEAKATCGVCAYEVKENGVITNEVKTAATCLEKGTTTYTATFTKFAVSTKDIQDIEKADHASTGAWQKDETNHWKVCDQEGCDEHVLTAAHTYGDVTYSWAEDASECTAKKSCTVCGYEVSETGVITSNKTKNETCTENGETTYTATFATLGLSTKVLKNVAPHAHTFGTMVAKVDRHRDVDGMEAHYRCTECEGYFDLDKKPTTANALKIANTFGTFEASTEYTFEFEKPYQKGDILTIDFKLDAGDDKFINFCLMDNSWANHTKYVKLYNNGRLGNHENGVSIGRIREDGYVRITIDTGVIGCEGELSQIDFLYIRKAASNVGGSIEFDPIGGTVDKGESIQPGSYIYLINKWYDLIHTVSTFDVTFITDGVLKFLLQQDSTAEGKTIELYSNGTLSTKTAGVKVSKILPVDSGVIGKYRLTVDCDSYVPNLTKVNMLTVTKYTTANCVIDINSDSSYELESNLTLTKTGSLVYLPKVYKNEETSGKFLSFNYKLNAGTTGSDSISLCLTREWDNVSSNFKLYGNNTAGLSGVVTELDGGWNNVKIDVNKFAGNGADKSYINAILVQYIDGDTTAVTIDMDSFGFVADGHRTMDNGLDLLKFVSPLANWKTSGKKIVFDYVHIPNSNGYQKDVFDLLDSNGSVLAQFTVRATDHTYYDGSQSTLINNQIVQVGDAWRVTVDLSLLTPRGSYTGEESLAKITCSTSNWSMKLDVWNLTIVG